ncbi:MAG: UDP-3-O-(3-hydroxymyristoyl)glucosamine N-acyltransferase [Ignavibacteriales bacterium]|nr:UDP-3-O-(3-hydroxymyristoyl)glucosamine N-acyltransferase [Ignavibacteriales bacterium]
MELTLRDVAEGVGAEIVGDGDERVRRMARIDHAEPGDLTFLYHRDYKKYFPDTRASAIIVGEDFERTREDIVYLVAKDPKEAFYRTLIGFFTPPVVLEGIHERATVDPTATLGADVALGANAYVGARTRVGDGAKIFHNATVLEDVEIGAGSVLYPGVVVREGCKIGKNVIVHAGAVIGADGFGYLPPSKETGEAHVKIPQIGDVVVEDGVEIGANSTIDRAAMGSTVVERDVKIDNLVLLGHNVSVGAHTAISGQSGVSGSTKIGARCVFGGQVGLAGHIEIGDDVSIGAKTGVSRSLLKPGAYFGIPAKELRTTLKLEAHFRKLPEYERRIKELEAIVESLAGKRDS